MAQFRAAQSYELQSVRAADAHCTRYQAITSTGIIVELCVLTRSSQARIDWSEQVKRLKLAALVRHPAVRQIRDMALDQDPQFVVLESIAETTLAAEHPRQPLSLPEAIQLGQHLAEGLVHFHRLGIIHGGIQPTAILARGNREWLLDITESILNPRTSVRAEPAAEFVAPEVPRDGEPELASDVFSLAAVLDWLMRPEHDSCEASLLAEFKSLLLECQRDDPAERPSPGQMALRLSAITDRLRVHQPSNAGTVQESALAALNQTLVQSPSAENWGAENPTVTLRRLGRFELQDKLGEGGMGSVYRARDVADDRVVAVKVLNARMAANPESRRRFAKEARLLAKANNPYVANLLEFNDDEGLYYLAVEFISGGSVAKLLQDHGHLEESASLALISDAARGLAVAHQRGIIHRDIKPDNLLLTAAGLSLVESKQDSQWNMRTDDADEPLIKVSDFGLARVEQQSESLAITRDGAVLGTPWYMSPEQCRGLPVDARSDVYSLGATLFHLIAGHPPFDGESHVAVINKHCHETPPSLRQLRPEISEAAANVVEKCLAKNPDARYANAGELQDDLERLLSGEPTSLLLHPPTPMAGDGEVLEFHFTCELSASPSQLWPYVSHTDRVNHALGLPAVHYTTRSDPRQGVQRFAEAKVAGQRIAWQEHPYEWLEGRRMSVLREFSKGPFSWFVNVVEISPRIGGGTRLTQTLKVAPRNLLGRWLAKWQLGRKSLRSFRRVYDHIDAYLVADRRQIPTEDPFSKATGMSLARRNRLYERLEKLRENRIDPAVIEVLGQFLEHASDLEVARIRPLAFAERFDLDPQQVVSACLIGAREGLLVLLWDILCPSCQIPADVQETLQALREHSYCPACDLRYEVDFANSVEMIFRAHPELRTVETRTYCIGGPAFSAHVVAQSRLAVGERLALQLNLEEGVYRIRGPQLPFAVDLRISPRGNQNRWELPLLRPPSRNSTPQLRAGSQVVTLWNNTARELIVRLERTAGRPLAFTAAAASALALFREMFPDQILSPGQIVSITTVTLALVEVHAAGELYRQLGDGPAFARIRQTLAGIEEVVRRYGGAVVKIVGDGLLATFADPSSAVLTGINLLRSRQLDELPLRIALHHGPALVTTLNDRLDYFGATPQFVRDMHSRATAGDLLLSDEMIRQPETTPLLREHECYVEVLANSNGKSADIVYRCRPGSHAGPLRDSTSHFV